MPSCQRADARWLSSHPRSRADGRTVPVSSAHARHMALRRTAPLATVLMAERQRGWEDRRRAKARRQEGMGSSGNLRTAPTPREPR